MSVMRQMSIPSPASLIGAGRHSTRFAKGAIAAIEFDEEPALGEGTLRWLITPKFIR